LRQAIEWPTSVYESRAYGYLALYGPPSVAEPYKEAMQHCRLPEAIMGQARVLELCGQYGSAAHYYGQALSANPGDEAARTAKTEAEERAALARRMEKLLPQGYRVHRILGDPTWRDGRMTYLVGVANQAPPQLEMGIGAGRLALFGREGDQLRKLAVTPVFSHRELTTAGYDPTAHVAAFTPQPGQRAMLAVIRAGLGGTLVWPNWWWRASPWWHPGLCYDMVLYSVERGHLAKTLQARSAAMPWVGDLDGDEDIEMVTWQEVSRELQQPDRVPWPIVRTLVKGRYEVRTEEFPMLFEPVPRVLAKRKHRYRSDPKLADHLGRAFEILGRREEAAAAYELAEQKYRATAERKAKKGEADQARLHTLAAEAVKHRRVRLEREGGS
jgi:tetratricopeptide (TPR) repeat protein